jgi:lysyl-tRNA synthetase class 1
VLRHYEAIMGVMLPTLRKERQATYSPVLPISPKSGIVLQVPVEVLDADAGLIRFDDEGETIEQSILGGRPSCSGRSTGRCAGSRSASITRWRARI